MSGPFLHGGEYVDLTPGHWVPHTASVDWCEANYQYSKYVAEAWNVVSMAPMLAVCVLGNVLSWRHGYGFSFHLVFTVLGIVALGSCWFHATLSYEGQVLDELPMIYGTIVGLYIIFERGKETKYPVLAPALVAYTICFTAAYFLTPEYFILFLVSYIGGLIAIVVASYQILQLPMSKAHPHQGRLVLLAVIILLGGAVLWFAENLFCPSLRGLHFHAIFHCTCAAG